MRAMAERLRSGRDRGAVLVLAAFMFTGLFIVTAIVVDLGLVRHVRRSNQSAVDLSALAAGDALGADPAPDGRGACSDAVNYLQANLDVVPAGLAVPCSSLPAVCNSLTSPVTVTDGGTGGVYNISVTYPVSDAAIADSDVASADSLRVDDGLPCERLMVETTKTFESLFSSIVGRDSFNVNASAVVRQVQSSDRRIPSVWLLDPVGCPVLSVSGGSSVIAGSATSSGLITIDSDASACNGNSYSIDVSGAGSLLYAIPDPANPAVTLDPPAQISLVAMERLQLDCAVGNTNACDPADVASLTLYPQPIRRASRATRAPVDHVYNCQTSYPDYHGIAVAGCTSGVDPYINDLRTEIGAIGTPAGFQLWSNSYGCNNPTTPVGGLTGNWRVDCSTFRLTGNTVTFNDGNVIFDGDITLTSGQLNFNAANPASSLPAACLNSVIDAVTDCVAESSEFASWVYMRSGNLTLTGGGLTANHAMIYQHDGYFSVSGGSPPIWTSPSEGPFAGLAVWSEKSSGKYKINGGASMNLEGVFFTPEAASLNISGGAPVIPQRAQFVSYRLAVSGGASLTLSPNPDLSVTLAPDAPLLIR